MWVEVLGVVLARGIGVKSVRDVGVVRGTGRVLPGKVWGVLRRLRGGTGSPGSFSTSGGGAGTYLPSGILDSGFSLAVPHSLMSRSREAGTSTGCTGAVRRSAY